MSEIICDGNCCFETQGALGLFGCSITRRSLKGNYGKPCACPAERHAALMAQLGWPPDTPSDLPARYEVVVEAEAGAGACAVRGDDCRMSHDRNFACPGVAACPLGRAKFEEIVSQRVEAKRLREGDGGK